MCLHVRAHHLLTSWMFFIIFPPLQGDTRTALGGTVKVVPSRIHPEALASLESISSMHMQAIARGVSTLASFMLVCVTMACRVENDPK